MSRVLQTDSPDEDATFISGRMHCSDRQVPRQSKEMASDITADVSEKESLHRQNPEGAN